MYYKRFEIDDLDYEKIKCDEIDYADLRISDFDYYDINEIINILNNKIYIFNNDVKYKEIKEQYKMYKYIYKENNNPVGLIYGWIKDDYLYIDLVFVDKKKRNSGVACFMFNNLLKELEKQKQVKLIYTELIQQHERFMLKGILQKLGFIPVVYYLVFKNRLIMYKEINKELESDFNE